MTSAHRIKLTSRAVSLQKGCLSAGTALHEGALHLNEDAAFVVAKSKLLSENGRGSPAATDKLGARCKRRAPVSALDLRIPSLPTRARALATVWVWKKRLEHQARSRFGHRGGDGLPVTTGIAL